MPLSRAGCIRVTHPCAGRRLIEQALSPMPRNLHVLSLPLAFILSQDQTLRCCIFSSFDFLFVCSSLPYTRYTQDGNGSGYPLYSEFIDVDSGIQKQPLNTGLQFISCTFLIYLGCNDHSPKTLLITPYRRIRRFRLCGRCLSCGIFVNVLRKKSGSCPDRFCDCKGKATFPPNPNFYACFFEENIHSHRKRLSI